MIHLLQWVTSSTPNKALTLTWDTCSSIMPFSYWCIVPPLSRQSDPPPMLLIWVKAIVRTKLTASSCCKTFLYLGLPQYTCRLSKLACLKLEIQYFIGNCHNDTDTVCVFPPLFQFIWYIQNNDLSTQCSEFQWWGNCNYMNLTKIKMASHSQVWL